ncbi:Cyclin-dependent kinase inhibitor [Macleaya cordata]|uniref:Cyclin-dependent kinase inhibitor n=1 Tax=Macleaya cordata TaxID=56857 RepID=A0A200QIU7_MACCD|nr:Cyclin-dependent kinase inhibitor [Macleaya cordata]
MGKYMKKCKAMLGHEVAVLEVGHQHVGVRTRARTLAMAGTASTTATTAAAAAAAAKKRKISTTSSELQFTSSFIQLRSRRKLLITSENSISPTNSENSISACVIPSNSCSSPSSDHVRTASRCSSNGSCMLINESLISSSAVDLKGEGFEIENSITYSHCRERRETTPSSNLRAESGDLESTERLTAVAANSRHRSSTTMENKMMPSEEELEDFFSAAEKEEQKRFSDRYNFDIVKDVPLEGRYEWVRLTQ